VFSERHLWREAAKQALQDAEMGRFREARQNADFALRLARTRDPLMLSATALALAGNSNRAQMLSRELNTRFPSDTLVQEVWLPLIGAGIALSRGNSRKAIELLHPVTPYDLSRDSDFLPNYLRGQAYLQVHAAPDAAQEFRKILHSRGAHPTSPVYVLAQLGLFQASAQMGDVEGGRKIYENFLTLWKDADPDIPILQQAKAEYARLQ
jgi:eukaryotic-like serine/threonine-protein kinase